jgi:hypothetical protein
MMLFLETKIQTMKKYVLLTMGFTPPTPEIMQSWMQWFESIGDRIVEQVGLVNGKEITKEGVSDLSMDDKAITGYLVIEAESMVEAVKIAEYSPMIAGTRVYEVVTQKGIK